MILDVIFVMDGWIYSSRPKAVRDALANTTELKLIDKIATANPDTGCQLPAKLFCDEGVMLDIRSLAKQGIRPIFYLVERKK